MTTDRRSTASETYTYSAPASVPVAGLEALVEELRAKVRDELGQGPAGHATLYCAGRIAQLIQEAK